MAKGFNFEDKRRIREALLKEGRKAFEQNGLRKTNVGNLSKAVGIAQGSFYLFFSSKEELYFEVVEEEEAKIKMALQDEFLDQELTKQMFQDFLIRGLSFIKNSPLIQQLYKSEDFQQLIKKLPPERLQQHAENDLSALTPFLEKWIAQGKLTEERPEVITALLRSYFLMTFHKKEIGHDVFDDAIKKMAEILADGLVKDDDND